MCFKALRRPCPGSHLSLPLIASVRGFAERLELSDTSKASISRASAAARDAEAGKRGKDMAIPTDPQRVQTMLREVGEPVCYFGERAPERRRRLTLRMGELLLEVEEGVPVTARQHAALTSAVATGEEHLRAAVRAARARGTRGAAGAAAAAADASPEEAEFRRASGELVEARLVLGDESLRRSAARLARQREVADSPGLMAEEDVAAARVVARVRHMTVGISEVADSRPSAVCVVAQAVSFPGLDGDSAPSHEEAASSSSSSSSAEAAPAAGGTGVVAAASFTGTVRVMSLDGLRHVRALRGHSDRVSALAVRPGEHSLAELTPPPPTPSSSSSSSSSGDAAAPGPAFLASGGTDMRIHLWGSASDTPVATLRGHAHRLSKLAWHPHGRLLGSTSYDTTWRLWDVDAGRELLLQEGHASETYAIAFHPDGALAATGDLGGVGRVWDLRTGRAVTTLRGHAKQLVALDFAPDGITLASGSEDHSCMVWDLRSRRPLATLPAHTSLVSGVRFAPTTGAFLVTSSFDGTLKAWETRGFSLLSVLRGHSGRVMGMDVAQDESSIVSCGWDRTVKVWREPSGKL